MQWTSTGPIFKGVWKKNIVSNSNGSELVQIKCERSNSANLKMLSCGWHIYLLRMEDLKRETTVQSKKSSRNNWKNRLVSFNNITTISLPSYKKILDEERRECMVRTSGNPQKEEQSIWTFNLNMNWIGWMKNSRKRNWGTNTGIFYILGMSPY